MAPEQLRGEPTDVRGDIWAAGAVWTRWPPERALFPETNGPLLIDAILNRDPQPPSKWNATISPGLENIILKALQKDLAKRYATAPELAADLERLTAGMAPLAKSAKPKWPPIAIGIVLFLLLAAGAAYFFLHHTTQKPTSHGASTSSRRSVAVLGFKNLSRTLRHRLALHRSFRDVDHRTGSRRKIAHHLRRKRGSREDRFIPSPSRDSGSRDIGRRAQEFRKRLRRPRLLSRLGKRSRRPDSPRPPSAGCQCWTNHRRGFRQRHRSPTGRTGHPRRSAAARKARHWRSARRRSLRRQSFSFSFESRGVPPVVGRSAKAPPL